MSRRRSIILIASSLIAVFVIFVVFHLQLETWFWHVRHGTSLVVGDYVVPVPSDWHVESIGDGDQAMVRLGTDDYTARRKLKAHAGLILHLGRVTDHDLNLATTLDEASMKKAGVTQVLHREFPLDTGRTSCVGGEVLGSQGTYDIEPVSWICRSSGGLEIRLSATEPDISQVWQIISGIRRKQ